MSQMPGSCVTSVVLVGSLEHSISNIFVHSGEILGRIHQPLGDGDVSSLLCVRWTREMAQRGFCATTCPSDFTSEQICTTLLDLRDRALMPCSKAMLNHYLLPCPVSQPTDSSQQRWPQGKGFA